MGIHASQGLWIVTTAGAENIIPLRYNNMYVLYTGTTLSFKTVVVSIYAVRRVFTIWPSWGRDAAQISNPPLVERSTYKF